MASSMSFGESRQETGGNDAYDLEAQLASAEHRYSLARERSRKARDECHALEDEQDARAALVKQARGRYEAAEAKCARLKQLIADLEERLG
jgi:chromosome segregation ATPase